ncbi:hypothetical protein GCM10017044_17710 [Kordiimonas sediminis]|uniref:Aminotransferase class V domain-containing protein n=1 Tax=Kordiimonas sediminis TaxID=1735581 RepID=A0A919ATY5_9PROT|nr:hypothetical protein [Kordiimonas sediminis]GHF23605.1 hypothetical protein GCM10017044_17710 [Kordiimonas sediminis]
MTPLEDARCYGGITSFRLSGKNSIEENKALAEKLIMDHNIFTVHRVGLNSGSCIRVTPNVYNSTDDIDAFIHAIKAIAG